MKRVITGMAVLMVVSTTLGFAGDLAEHESDRYLVRSQIGEEHAEQTAERMEAMFDLYNEFMRFETETVTQPLRLRIFADHNAFAAYLEDLIGAVPDDYVYLHYRDPERNELVAYQRPEPEYGRGLAHQGFVQFFRAFIDNPPAWLQEGFAVYFEHAEFNEEKAEASLVENLSWLETARAIYTAEENLPVERVLETTPEEAEAEIERFYPQAWALISFLLHAENREYSRLLWDSLSALEAEATRAENVAAVERASFNWVDNTELERDLTAYLQERRSPAGLVEDGVEAYSTGALQEAEEYFLEAAERDPENHVAYYYLGLINYDAGNHGLAEYYYMRAGELGAEQAVVQFALGVNAFAAGSYGSAEQYLENAIELDAERYAERAEQLLSRMPN